MITFLVKQIVTLTQYVMKPRRILAKLLMQFIRKVKLLAH